MYPLEKGITSGGENMVDQIYSHMATRWYHQPKTALWLPRWDAEGQGKKHSCLVCAVGIQVYHYSFNLIHSFTDILKVSSMPGMMQNMGDTMMKTLDTFSVLMFLQSRRRCILNE